MAALHMVTLDGLEWLSPMSTSTIRRSPGLASSTRSFAPSRLSTHVRDVDRVVPVGRALDMNFVWNGSDIVGNLSRAIHTR